MKKIILLTIILTPFLSFAIWSQPTATPPGGNTEPPINVGTATQYKKGTVGAFKFCIYNASGAVVDCLGQGTGNSNWPWKFSGNSINNTNTGGDVNVSGRLCLNGSCTSNWNDLIGGYFNTNFANYFNNLNNSDDLAKVTSRGANTGETVGVGSLNSVNNINIINGSLCLRGDCRDSWPSSVSTGGSVGGGTTGGGVAGVSSITAGSGISVSSNTGDIVISSTVTSTSGGGGGTTGPAGKPGDTNGDGVYNYNDLPSGASAGYCSNGYAGASAMFPGTPVVQVTVAPATGGLRFVTGGPVQTGGLCSCESGWSIRLTGAYNIGATVVPYYTCIKN